MEKCLREFEKKTINNFSRYIGGIMDLKDKLIQNIENIERALQKGNEVIVSKNKTDFVLYEKIVKKIK